MFPYRGFMLDSGRHMQALDDIKRLIDAAANLDFNIFHWHLTEDQGWRFESSSYPLLNTKASVRPYSDFGKAFDDKPYGGIYTKDEMRDIVAYCKERGITVVPEFDMPGHVSALLSVFPELSCRGEAVAVKTHQGIFSDVLCLATEQVYEVIFTLLDEFLDIFPSEYIHIGGDEAPSARWEKCPACRSLMEKEGMTGSEQLHGYFVSRVNDIAGKYGKKIAGWEEIMQADNIKDNALIYVWHSKKWGPQAVGNGFDCIMQAAEFVYLDMQQSKMERGHNWARIIPLDVIYSYDPIGLAAAGKDGRPDQANLPLAKKHVKGVQAGLWGELGNRPDNFTEYQMFPRLCALSETAWGTSRTIADSTDNYRYFYDRLTQAHFKRLQNMGIRFRVPYPEVKAEPVAITKLDVLRQGSDLRPYKISVTEPFEGAQVRYAIVAPYTAVGNIRGQKDTTDYKYIYTEPIITENIANYRFATFVSDTLHSVGVAVSNMPLQKHYIEAPLTIQTNMRCSEKNLSILKEYKKNAYCRFEGRAKAGDYITFTFDQPVKCSVIDILTGRSNVDFYGLTEGYAEYSEDGVNYKGKTEVDCSRIVLTPNTTVKSVRITVTGESDGQNFFLTPLVIY